MVLHRSSKFLLDRCGICFLMVISDSILEHWLDEQVLHLFFRCLFFNWRPQLVLSSHFPSTSWPTRHQSKNYDIRSLKTENQWEKASKKKRWTLKLFGFSLSFSKCSENSGQSNEFNAFKRKIMKKLRTLVFKDKGSELFQNFSFESVEFIWHFLDYAAFTIWVKTENISTSSPQRSVCFHA